MAERIFFDTNILIYARDRKNAAKRETARRWLAAAAERRAAIVNLQVLNELSNWLLRNETLRQPAAVRAEVEGLRAWGARPLDADDVACAWDVRAALGYSWFDCLLVASAARDGCRYFVTEDMTDGAEFRGMRLVDPFTTPLAGVFSTR